MTAAPVLPRTAALGAGVARFRPAPVLAWAVVGLVVVAAVWPELLTARSPDDVDPGAALALPSAEHWFGTDQLGRDLYARIVHGARTSVLIGLGATAIAVVAGSLLGVLAAVGGRWTDEVITRVTDVLLAFPGLLLALLVIALLGPGPLNATLAIGIGAVPGYVRLARGQALVVHRSGYVRAARVLGRSPARVFVGHTLPNSLPPVQAFAGVDVGTALMAGSALSFLGLGPQPPTPEWGAMLAEGRDYVAVAWPLAVFPGLAVTVTVIALNVAGGRLRTRFEGGTHV